MTRSEFFKKIGLGVLVCAVAPRVLAEIKPKTQVYWNNEPLEGVGNVKINFNEANDIYGFPSWLKSSSECFFIITTYNDQDEAVYFKVDETGVHQIPTLKNFNELP